MIVGPQTIGDLLQRRHECVLFRHRCWPHSACVAPIDRKRQAERRVLALLEDSGLPLPDEVEYGTDCVRFLWLDRKVVVVVDLEEFDEGDANGGYTREGITA